MTYAINGKQYNEFDINKRCAELIGVILAYGNITGTLLMYNYDTGEGYDPCNSWDDCGPIIEKCSNMLLSLVNKHGEAPKSKEGILWTRWQHLQELHNCSKLVAACICFIETNQ